MAAIASLSPSLSPPVLFCPLTKTDTPFLAQIFTKAFASRELTPIIFNATNDADRNAISCKYFTARLAANYEDNRRKHIMVAQAPATREPVGFIITTIVNLKPADEISGGSNNEDGKEDPKNAPETHQNTGRSEDVESGLNKPFCDGYFGELDRRRHSFMSNKGTYIHLNYLAVLPTWQRKGVGAALMQHVVTNDIDEAGLPAYLNGQVGARRLYERFGWQEVDVVRTNLGEWGGEGVNETVCMFREAKGTGVEVGDDAHVVAKNTIG
ncbi:MAG: hypothetical protein Q9164_001468 [Protoblastenia rupestris]